MSGQSRTGLIGRLLDDFELSWKQSPPSDLERFYRDIIEGEARVLDPANRTSLLEELVKLDLEFRWRPGPVARERWRVRDYVKRFPELRSAGWDPVQLLCEEFRARWQWGDRPSRETFAAEHTGLESRLSAPLSQIEKSLNPPTAETPLKPPSRTDDYVPAPIAPVPVPRPAGARVPPPPDAPKIPGYEIEGVLGRGGMGVVYKAWDVGLRRHVALKLILAGAHAGDHEVARFRSEAQSIAKLKHPNIVQIFAFGEVKNLPWFALEYVEGGSLAARLAGVPQPPAAAAEFVESVARAMGFAHSAGIVHRDLKPANILLEVRRTGEGAPGDRRKPAPEMAAKVTDFGLAKRLDDGDSQKTRDGAVMGTPSYMAPEQAAGRNDAVGPPADTYAIGAILYEMLVGRPPFKGASLAETLDLVRHRDPISPRLLQPTVPLDLETICLKCLRKEPGERYASAVDLADDLRRYLDGKPILARPVGSAELAWKFYRRNPGVVYAGVAMLSLLLVASVASGIAAFSAASRARAIDLQAKAEGEKDAAELGEVKARLEKVESEKARDRKILAQNYDLRIGISERELSTRHGDVALAEKTLDSCPVEARGWEWNYLARQCDGAAKPLAGHEAGLWNVAFNPADSNEVSTASIDGTVRVWDAASGTSTALTGHKVEVEKLVGGVKALSKIEKAAAVGQIKDQVDTAMSLLTGGNSPVPKLPFLPSVAPKLPFVPSLPGVPQVPNLPAVPSLAEVPQNLSPVVRVAYSPDGNFLASGALDPNVDLASIAVRKPTNPIGTVIVWNRDRTIRTRFTGHRVLVSALAFTIDGLKVASAGMDDDHCWKLWDRDTGAVERKFLGHKGWVVQVRFSPDGRTAASGSTDGTAILWDVKSGKPLNSFTRHRATVSDLAFSRDGKFLATAGMDGNVYVWDLTEAKTAGGTGEPVQLRGHIGSALSVSFNHDGTRVASAGFDRTVRLWDPRSGAELSVDGRRRGDEKITLRGHTDAVWSVNFSKDGLKLASASFDGNARVWDSSPVREPKFPGSFAIGNPEDRIDEDHRVNRIAFSPDGARMATASWDGTVGVYDAKTGAPVRKLEHGGPAWGAAFSPDGRRVVSGSWDTTVRLWDVATGNEEKRWTLKSPVQSVAWSRGGRYVAAAGWDGIVKIWDVSTGAELSVPIRHYLPVFSLSFSPDDRYILSGSGDRTARVWPLDGGAPAVLGGNGATVYTVAFDKTGTRIATACWDNTVKLWRFGSGSATLERELKDPTTARGDREPSTAHADYVYGVGFSPDGRSLATVGNDKILRLWDAATGALSGESRTLRGVVWDVAYHPDGDRLATAVWNPKCWVKVLPAKP